MRQQDIRVPRHESFGEFVGLAFGATQGDLEMPWRAGSRSFDELVGSWNVIGEPFVVEAQLATTPEPTASASPWLEIGSFGGLPRGRSRTIEFAAGKVDIDVIVAREDARFHAARLRFRSSAECRLERYRLTFTDRRLGAHPLEVSGVGATPLELDVPFLSQKAAPESIRGRICSPTSVAMVLRFHGRDVTAEGIAAEVFDPEQDLYGIWPRNVQVAFRHGVPGSVCRFDSWDDVEAVLRSGRPIIASIGVAKGQLDGAPYETTSGHLIVLRGIDRNGDLLVNDPAVASPERGRLTYRRDQLSTCWLARGGTAYVLGSEKESTHVRH